MRSSLDHRSAFLFAPRLTSDLSSHQRGKQRVHDNTANNIQNPTVCVGLLLTKVTLQLTSTTEVITTNQT